MRVAREGKPNLPGTEGEVLRSFCWSACGWSQFMFVHKASHCNMYWAKCSKQSCQRQREKFYIVCVGVHVASPCSCLCKVKPASHWGKSYVDGGSVPVVTVNAWQDRASQIWKFWVVCVGVCVAGLCSCLFKLKPAAHWGKRAM